MTGERTWNGSGAQDRGRRREGARRALRCHARRRRAGSAEVIGIKDNAVYTAAKHGVIGLTRASALEYAAQNLRINAVCPGYIDTPMIERFAGRSAEARAKVIAEEPIGRMGTAEEIAATVVWMCSDAAGFMVGHALVVDGGQKII